MNWEKELERKKQKSAQKLEEYKIKATFRSEKRKFNSGLFHTKFFESTTKVVTWLVLLLCAFMMLPDNHLTPDIPIQLRIFRDGILGKIS